MNAGNLPVIRLPVRIRENLTNLSRSSKNLGRLVIDSSKPVFRHYQFKLYPESRQLPLASKSWTNRTSHGQWLKIHSTQQHNSGLQSECGFNSLGLTPNVCDVLTAANIQHPTVIQALAIPKLLHLSNHVLLAANTGSGKTLAYLTPILQKSLENELSSSNECAPIAVIAQPSSDLCHQLLSVCKQINLTCEYLNNNTLPSSPVDVIVGCPGILVKNVRSIIRTRLRWVVLDEVDTLLDDSFIKVTKRVLQDFNFQVGDDLVAQLVLSGATLHSEFSELLNTTVDPKRLNIVKTPELHKVQNNTTHHFYRVGPASHFSTLLKILRKFPNFQTIVFCNTTATCFEVHKFLQSENIKCACLHGKLHNNDRRAILELFSENFISVLVATDVASRGIDPLSTRHIVNFDCPLHISDYIHRSGRVGRIGSAKGSVTSTIVTRPFQASIVQNIERAVRLNKPLDSVDANIQRKFREMHESNEVI